MFFLDQKCLRHMIKIHNGFENAHSLEKLIYIRQILVHLRGSHLKDLQEILYRAFSWKPVEKSHVWLKSGKNIAHFKWRALKS